MSPNGIVPSSHYPDYLRQDLRVGEPDAHPLAAALDEVFAKWFLLAQKSAHGLLPRAWSDENCDLALEHHGFVTASLAPSVRREFFRALPELFAMKGDVRGIELLASYYFLGARVQRGRTDAVKGLGNGIRLPLRAVDVSARDNLIIVRHAGAADAAAIAEFTMNAKRLLPDHFDLLVATEPVAPSAERKEMQIGKGIRLERRRL